MLPVLSNVLAPLGAIYGFGVSLRNRFFDCGLLPQTAVGVPVISVGNVTLGGNGKTPFCIFLLQLLQAGGCQPVLLSRGYRGTATGPTLVMPEHTASEVGDEALLFKMECPEVPVVVSRKRLAGAQFIVENKLGNCIVLDDGLQHRYLKRDLNLLLIDSKTPGIPSGAIDERILPVGRLREPVSDALKRVDAVLHVCKEAFVKAPKLEGYTGPQLIFSLVPAQFVDVASGEVFAVTAFAKETVSVCTAIAQPESVVRTLVDLGIETGERIFFRDHALFTEQMVRSLEKRSEKRIIVTAKDAVKLQHLVSTPGKIFALHLKGDFANNEYRAQFQNMLNAVIPSALSITRISSRQGC